MPAISANTNNAAKRVMPRKKLSAMALRPWRRCGIMRVTGVRGMLFKVTVPSADYA